MIAFLSCFHVVKKVCLMFVVGSLKNQRDKMLIKKKGNIPGR